VQKQIGIHHNFLAQATAYDITSCTHTTWVAH